jgi:hypothetical protein
VHGELTYRAVLDVALSYAIRLGSDSLDDRQAGWRERGEHKRMHADSQRGEPAAPTLVLSRRRKTTGWADGDPSPSARAVVALRGSGRKGYLLVVKVEVVIGKRSTGVLFIDAEPPDEVGDEPLPSS